MTNIKNCFNPSVWLVALLAMTLLAGCGGGTWDGKSSTGNPPVSPIAPTVTASNPNPDATNVAVASAINMTFSADMDADSIDENTFTVTGPGTSPVTGVVTYSAANKTATFVPAQSLEFGTLYTASISTVAQDADGTNLVTAHSWAFTTVQADFIAVDETNPVNESTAVCTNKAITVVFDTPLDPITIESPAMNFMLAETVNGTEVDGVATLDDAGTTLTFTPSSALAAGIEYTATINTDVTDVNGNPLENNEEWTFTTSTAFCQAAVTLGKTKPYGVLSNASVTLGGGPNSTTGLRVDGDVGIFPAGACTGCDSTTVSGQMDIGNTAASDAMDDLLAAYNDAINRATNRCTLIDSGVLATNPSATCGGGANGVFAPGLYWSGSSIAIPAGGTITLDAKNDPDAVFIFQSESTINTIGGNTHVILANGAQAKNVFWVAVSSATIGGTNSDFAGTVIAQSAITVSTGTAMLGRALARTAAVTVEDNALITVPTE